MSRLSNLWRRVLGGPGPLKFLFACHRYWTTGKCELLDDGKHKQFAHVFRDDYKVKQASKRSRH